MKLLTQEDREHLPPLRAQEHAEYGEQIAYVKFFGSGRWTWYATEFDGDDMFFGYVVSGLGEDCDEWGYFSLRELSEIKFPPFGLPIERDLDFTPKAIREELRERWGKELQRGGV